MYKKQLILPQINNENKLFFCYLENAKLLLIKSILGGMRYVKIPSNLVLEKQNNILFLKSNKNALKELISASNNIKLLFNNINKVFYKKLILRGLGFRMNLVEDKNSLFLKLKLGFSHLLELAVPQNKIQIFLKKNSLILKSSDLVFLGNFARKLKNLKYPNAYNGKGFWYKNEKISYKHFKKK